MSKIEISDINYYLNRKVFIRMKNKKEFLGIALNIENGTLFSKLIIKDKYGYLNNISISEIDKIQEDDGDYY